MTEKRPIIWDPIIRTTHWITAILFFVDYFFIEGGENLHQWLGYLLLVSVVVRLIWGFIGSPHARFNSFLPSITSLKHYLSSPKDFKPAEGHNPLGALMALFLWTGLVICVISGHLQETDMFWGEDWPELMHEISADVILIAVAIHVMAVFTIQWLTKQPLIRKIITGKRL